MPQEEDAAKFLSEKANAELLKILAMIEPQDLQNEAFGDSIKVMQKISLEKQCKQIYEEATEVFGAGDKKAYEQKKIELLENQRKLDML